MLGIRSLEKPKSMVKEWIKVLRCSTSFYMALLILSQIWIIAGASLFVPLFLRWAILPSSTQQKLKLNLVFVPCEHNFHGICSFPTAYIDPIKLGIFETSTSYQISVQLHFSDSETNYSIGIFQNELTLLDVNETQIQRWRRTGRLKQPGVFIKALLLMFSPLYILGFLNNYNILEIPLVTEYYASPDKMAYHLNYALQSRLVEVDAAYLVINAKLGFIKHFLHYWPLTSFLLLLAVTAGNGFFALAIFWSLIGYRSYRKRSWCEQNGVMEPSASRLR